MASNKSLAVHEPVANETNMRELCLLFIWSSSWRISQLLSAKFDIWDYSAAQNHLKTLEISELDRISAKETFNT